MRHSNCQSHGGKKKRGQKHLELSFLGRLRGQSHQRVTHLKVLRAGHGEKGTQAREPVVNSVSLVSFPTFPIHTVAEKFLPFFSSNK